MSYPLPLSCRRVRRVHLSAPAEAWVRRGAVLLEDALHTASVPGETDSRLLVIRHLNVGTIHPQWAANTLALTIEQRLRQLTTQAVYALYPQAAQAPAVYFADPADPYCQLMLRLAQGKSCHEWFWPLAVPEWRPGVTKSAALREIMLTLAQREAEPQALVATVSYLLDCGALAPVLQTLHPDDGPLLLHWIGGQAVGTTAAAPATPFAVPRMDLGDRAVRILRDWANRWGQNDARSHWLALILWRAAKPSRAVLPDLGGRSPHLLHHILAPQTSMLQTRDWQGDGGDHASVPPTFGEQRLIPPVQTTPSQSLTGEAPSGHRSFPVSPADTPTASAHSSPVDQPQPISQPGNAQLSGSPVSAAPEVITPSAPPSELPFGLHTTAFGGWFLLLPLLDRLDLATFLQTHPAYLDADIVPRLLHHLAQHVGIPAEDGIWSGLPEPLVPWPVVADPDWMASERWLALADTRHPWQVHPQGGQTVLTDGSGRLSLGCWFQSIPPVLPESWPIATALTLPPQSTAADPAALLLTAWLTAVRRWCRRVMQMGLLSLVCRPAQLAVTRTHVDVTFPLDQVDIRIRQVGLDVNPGWVPWFGKVVQFHYVDRG